MIFIRKSQGFRFKPFVNVELMNELQIISGYLTGEQSGHKHEHAHIYLPTSESIHLEISGSSFRLPKDALAVVHSNVFHHTSCPDKLLWFSFDENASSNIRCNVSDDPIVQIPDYLRKCIELIQYEVCHFGCSESSKYLGNYLFDKVFIKEAEHPSITYLEEHYTEPLSIDLLASIENYNRNYYISWFSKLMGKSPYDYILELRINKAKKLLLDTEYEISLIANYIGYSSNSAFSRIFKKTAGVSPTEYRKNRLFK